MPGAPDVGSFARLRDQMVAHVLDGGVGGVAWAVSVAGDIETGASGWLDPHRQEQPMPTDGIFRISSVSKPIVAVAALQLVDEGLVDLDGPVDEVLPELANRTVLLQSDGSRSADGLRGQTVPTQRPLTIRDLLTFRCGLGMDFDFSEPQPQLDQLSELGIGPGPTAPECSPNEFMARLGGLPLVDQPGTRWRYHTGSDILGVLIERVRAEPLDRVLERNVFAPLGMSDTGFWVGPDQHDRFGICRMSGEEGGDPTDELEIWDGPNGRWSKPPLFRSGATGLVSTTADLVAFGRMLLSGGEGPTGRLLTRALVDEMTTDQLTDSQRVSARIDGSTGALGWGLGVAVRHQAGPNGWPTVRSYGWDGGLGSRWLVDPAHDLCAVVLSTDAFTSSAAPAVMEDFVEVLGESILAGRQSW